MNLLRRSSISPNLCSLGSWKRSRRPSLSHRLKWMCAPLLVPPARATAWGQLKDWPSGSTGPPRPRIVSRTRIWVSAAWTAGGGCHRQLLLPVAQLGEATAPPGRPAAWRATTVASVDLRPRWPPRRWRSRGSRRSGHSGHRSRRARLNSFSTAQRSTIRGRPGDPSSVAGSSAGRPRTAHRKGSCGRRASRPRGARTAERERGRVGDQADLPPRPCPRQAGADRASSWPASRR